MAQRKPEFSPRESLSTLKRKHGVCFVICPLGKEDSEERKRSDILFDHIIDPVLKEFEFTTIRADKLNDSGKITEQIIEYLYAADLVIADLTDNNPNVFYELALRHFVGTPVIHLIKKGGEIPFDVKEIRALEYDLRADEAEKAKGRLRNRIEYLIEHPFKPLISAPNFLYPVGSQRNDQDILQQLGTCIRRLCSEWSTERDTNLPNTDNAKQILEESSAQLNQFVSLLNNGANAPLCSTLHRLIVRIKKLKSENTYLEDGKTTGAYWAEKFWSGGDAIFNDLTDCDLAERDGLSKERLRLELMVQAAEKNPYIAAQLSGNFDLLADMDEEQRKRIEKALKR